MEGIPMRSLGLLIAPSGAAETRGHQCDNLQPLEETVLVKNG